jgi:hypothetical protein
MRLAAIFRIFFFPARRKRLLYFPMCLENGIIKNLGAANLE